MQKFTYAAFAAMLSTLPLASQAEIADTILSGGKILTAGEDFSIVEALAIKDGRILATGGADAVADLIGEETIVINLDGKTVIPGLIDNHLHFIRGVWNNQTEVRLSGITSRAAALEHIAAYAAQAEPGTWVTTIGGDAGSIP
ncbi:amidohydrolase family protein [Alphaproteobacteria bacterium KMM 3653]|uniref:Amidohydrolase family protein n=1 Tax=Harenicola maris TaxID=2841044 RepID=A0AAP2CJY2_9RHOB|nr:amidohydrolase family protein [Harenicola maris]